MTRLKDFHRVALLIGAAVFGSCTLLMAQAGSLDASFGNGGIVTTPNTTTFCGQITPCGLAIQSDGKILVAGGAPQSNGAAEVAVARYNTNGSLDTSFGTGGIVTTSQGGVSGSAFGLALQGDGKIVVATTGDLDLIVIRYNTNGSLDTTFGSGGIAKLRPFNDRFFGPLTGGVAVESSGDILVAAQATVARLLTNGQVDSTFGTGGAAELVASAQSLTLVANGKFLVSSNFTPTAAARYNSNGSLDSNFGVAGQLANLGAASLIPLSNGKLVGVGSTVSATQPPPASSNRQGFVVVRYNANGAIDSTFGTHGGTVTTFPGEGFSSAAAVAVQSDGAIVAAGVTEVNNPVFGLEASDFALARYTANGLLDSSFGVAGLVTTAFGTNGGDSAAISALAIQADGKIVAAGNAFPTFGAANNGFVLARYLAQ